MEANNDDGDTALICVCSSYKSHPKTVWALLAAGAEVGATNKSEETARSCAIFNGYTKIAQMLENPPLHATPVAEAVAPEAAVAPETAAAVPATAAVATASETADDDDSSSSSDEDE